VNGKVDAGLGQTANPRTDADILAKWPCSRAWVSVRLAKTRHRTEAIRSTGGGNPCCRLPPLGSRARSTRGGAGAQHPARGAGLSIDFCRAPGAARPRVDIAPKSDPINNFEVGDVPWQLGEICRSESDTSDPVRPERRGAQARYTRTTAADRPAYSPPQAPADQNPPVWCGIFRQHG